MAVAVDSNAHTRVDAGHPARPRTSYSMDSVGAAARSVDTVGTTSLANADDAAACRRCRGAPAGVGAIDSDTVLYVLSKYGDTPLSITCLCGECDSSGEAVLIGEYVARSLGGAKVALLVTLTGTVGT